MMRHLALAFSLLAGCGPSFESESVELEYLDALSAPTPAQLLRRDRLRAAAVRSADPDRLRRAEEERRRNTHEVLEARAVEARAVEARAVEARARASVLAERAARVADEAARRAEERRRLEGRAAAARDAFIRDAVAKGMTPEAARAAHRERQKFTDRLDRLGGPQGGWRDSLEFQAALAFAAVDRDLRVKGRTPDLARAAYRDIVDRHAGTRAAAQAKERLDDLGPP